jgi:hemolysin III
MHAHPRAQSPGEELANAASHALGFVAALAALPVLAMHDGALRAAPRHPGVWVFAATLMLVYLSSALYHALPEGRAKRALRRLDHAAIFLFIAGSYTPFVLGVLRGGWGWSLFGIVWALAALGVAAKLLNRLRHPLASTALYVAMGWVAVIAVVPLVQRVPAAGLAWIVGGGLAYTAGALVFLLDNRVRYAHFAWHLFVMVGSGCHFFAVLGYAR